ncbi:MAG: hypothetical protein HC926_05015 [Synechococcaceae cyanobacterium SM2_3_60]|nr:hypothetical protein [Synechococcaceae cyanobacterium SM2_3_60]
MVALAPNPLRVGLTQERVPEPLVLTLFGASGDLAARKLVPSLFRLYKERRLPSEFAIVGVARRDWSHETYREKMKAAVQEFASSDFGPEAAWNDFAQHLYYSPLDMGDRESFEALNRLLLELDRDRHTRGNRVFYLAVSPTHFPTALSQLGDLGMIADPVRRLSSVYTKIQAGAVAADRIFAIQDQLPSVHANRAAPASAAS